MLYHGYQSFAEGEVAPDTAHKIGVDLAKELWGDRLQVLVCTHLDKQSHIHNHFLINTVSYVDGKKFYRSAKDYHKMQEVSDRLCREYGLSVIEEPERKGKHYSQWYAEKTGKPTIGSSIRADIDRAIRASLTEQEFFEALSGMGYEFKFYSKNGNLLERPSLKPKGAKKFFRFDNLGPDYDLEEIRCRILENIHRRVPFPEELREVVRHYRKEHPPKTKARGLAALYYYYCYELHILVRYPTSVKRVSYSMREDIRKLEKLDEQTRFLAANHVSTFDDLKDLRNITEIKLEGMLKERNVLKNELKRAVRQGDEAEITELKQKIAEVSAGIKKLRNDLSICDSVSQRAQQIPQDLREIEEQTERKEEKTDELLVRSGGAGREDVPQRR